MAWTPPDKEEGPAEGFAPPDRVVSTIPAVYGGKEASLGVGQDESLWDKARRSVSMALFGDPDRAEAKAAGVGLTPTPAELVQGAGMIASPIGMAGTAPAIGNVASKVAAATPGVIAKAASAYAAGKQGYRKLGVPGAVVGAVAGAALPVAGTAATTLEGYEIGGVPGAAVGYLLGGGKVSALKKMFGVSEAAIPAIEAAAASAAKVKGAVEAAPAVAQAAKVVADVGKVGAHKVGAQKVVDGLLYEWGQAGGWRKAVQPAMDIATVAEKAAPVAKGAEAAKAAFDASKTAAREFAKASGSKKAGEKIWMLLDEAGKPLKTLTPDQAGAAARAGKATTWVKNTWS